MSRNRSFTAAEVRLVQSVAWRTVRHFAGNLQIEDLQDLSQEAVGIVLRSANRAHDLARFTFGVARRVVRAAQRKRTNRRRLLEMFAVDLPVGADCSPMIPPELAFHLQEALKKLGEVELWLIHYRYYEHRSDAEIAGLGISPKLTSASGVANRRKRAEGEIEKFLRSKGFGGDEIPG